ncbi:fimbria/pilus periplasmic chaperone [Providencia sp. PROV188]|uniref:fimbrial biogenesis chaperone n=1 Tax=unclassified Providencia TaxID=2633465 RepID=UPI0012B58682|nr:MULTISPECIES: fimbria/pilus periplasmic chaperone [unclassified Providencia]MTC23247.1 fimbria/pilus periplasmic chaperone [Providencia sp. wls1938]MTC47296.1 fimbria/pilus periplasmic chaperone [Providencia sp. wls1922]MTC78300.1 fimbria/pilus periplasmic chaperone [Providencia sp. wls1916]WBM60994.1 fimbria/pilus periplasmic chaperone [Providencia sp. PROV188]
MITQASIRNKIILFFSLFAISTSIYASVIINGTRVVYNENSKSKIVQLVNENKWPALVQVWLDNGNPDEPPENIKTPFAITPPIFKMGSNSGQNLRITYLGEPLPKNKESIYYLNILEVPPENEDAIEKQQNTMQIAIRTRIKLFFRPEGIGMPALINEKLKFSFEKSEKGNRVLVKNDSPWYVTLQDITISNNSKKLKLENNMVAPFSTISLGNENGNSIPNEFLNSKKMNYSVINDYGGVDSYESNI